MQNSCPQMQQQQHIRALSVREAQAVDVPVSEVERLTLGGESSGAIGRFMHSMRSYHSATERGSNVSTDGLDGSCEEGSVAGRGNTYEPPTSPVARRGDPLAPDDPAIGMAALQPLRSTQSLIHPNPFAFGGHQARGSDDGASFGLAGGSYSADVPRFPSSHAGVPGHAGEWTSHIPSRPHSQVPRHNEPSALPAGPPSNHLGTSSQRAGPPPALRPPFGGWANASHHIPPPPASASAALYPYSNCGHSNEAGSSRGDAPGEATSSPVFASFPSRSHSLPTGQFFNPAQETAPPTANQAQSSSHAYPLSAYGDYPEAQPFAHSYQPGVPTNVAEAADQGVPAPPNGVFAQPPLSLYYTSGCAAPHGHYPEYHSQQHPSQPFSAALALPQASSSHLQHHQSLYGQSSAEHGLPGDFGIRTGVVRNTGGRGREPPPSIADLGIAPGGGKLTRSGRPRVPRQLISCDFCRIRKLRCDGQRPCGHCSRRGKECVFQEAVRKRGKGRKSSTPVATASASSPAASVASSVTIVPALSSTLFRGTEASVLTGVNPEASPAEQRRPGGAGGPPSDPEMGVLGTPFSQQQAPFDLAERMEVPGSPDASGSELTSEGSRDYYDWQPEDTDSWPAASGLVSEAPTVSPPEE